MGKLLAKTHLDTRSLKFEVLDAFELTVEGKIWEAIDTEFQTYLKAAKEGTLDTTCPPATFQMLRLVSEMSSWDVGGQCRAFFKVVKLRTDDMSVEDFPCFATR